MRPVGLLDDETELPDGIEHLQAERVRCLPHQPVDARQSAEEFLQRPVLLAGDGIDHAGAHDAEVEHVASAILSIHGEVSEPFPSWRRSANVLVEHTSDRE
jgi:hypothetical protein